MSQGTCCPCNQTAANETTVSTQTVSCSSGMEGMSCACSMSSMYLFAVLIVAGLAIQVFLQTKLLQAIRKLKK